MKKSKYKFRSDGKTKETTKVYSDFGPGKYRGRKHFYGHTDEEIDRKIAAFEKDLLSAPEGPVVLFSSVAERWWEEKEPSLSPNSVRGYRVAVSRSIEAFGDIPIDRITPLLCHQYLHRFALQGFSQKVINNTKIVLKEILDSAFLSGYISSNPCYGLPAVKGKPKQKRHPADEESLQKIEDSKTESLYAAMSYFMHYTGARRGEAVALQEKHVDRVHKKATICQTVAYADQRPQIKPPKTESGFRDVDLYDNVLEVLPEYGDPETFIFFPDGLPTKAQLEYGLKKYQTSHGITATAHQLRHSYASMLHSAGVDVKDAQHLLGHSTIAMTQDVYTELENIHKEELRNSLNEYVNSRINP